MRIIRRPQLYRPYKSREKKILDSSFPHLCAHRGLSSVCPENTLPAFAAALSLGVHEIELDLWMSRDGIPVVCHDPSVDRTTDGTGILSDMDWADISKLDAGIKFASGWRGIRIPRFEEVIKLVDGRAIMNTHIHDKSLEGKLVKLVCDLIQQNGRGNLAYIAGHSESVLKIARDCAPNVARACLIDQNDPVSQIKLAQKFDCQRIQFGRNVTEDNIQCAHESDLICNLFWSDEPIDAMAYVQKGIDVILTNCAHILKVLKT